MTSGMVIQREVFIQARPETVFQYFVDPARMQQWMGREAMVPSSAGHPYRIVINQKHVAVGQYLEVTPHSRVVFNWGWEGDEMVPPGSSIVEVTLTPEQNGTRLRLVHSGLPNEPRLQSHDHGWEHYVSRLAQAAAGQDPGPDPWAQE